MTCIPLFELSQDDKDEIIHLITDNPRVTGFIVAGFKDGEAKMYWSDFPTPMYRSFSNEKQENPKTFNSPSACSRRRYLGEKDCPEFHWKVCFWIHPDAHEQALEKYQTQSPSGLKKGR